MANNTSNEQIKIILDLLHKGDEDLKLDTHSDVVLILGNTGSGKSSFTHFVAGNNTNLESKEKGRGQFIIIDNNNKINNSTITSLTIFPELVVNTKTATTFYDCPGFSNTRSAAHDISASYFIKKILDSTNAVKLIFVVNYPSVKHGVDRLDFILLIKHITNMIKDIEKFKDSIALVITKVDNRFTRHNKKFILIPDEIIIKDIAGFMEGVKHDLKTKIELEGIPLHQQHFYKNGIKLIDAILTQRDQEYTKIGIFRRPNGSGALSNIKLLQKGKKSLERIIYQNIQFTVHAEEDFNYTISSDSKIYVRSLMPEINKSITSDIANIGQEIKEFYQAQEKQSHDIDKLYSKFKAGYYVLSGTKKAITESAEPSECIKEIIRNLNNLNINISSKNLLSVLNYNRYLKFLRTVSDQEMSRPIEWAQGLTYIIESLNNSQKWYSLLKRFYITLSKYDIQQNVKRFNITHLKTQFNAKGNKGGNITKLDFFKLLGHFNKQAEYDIEYRNMEDITVDEFKLRALEKVLDFTLNHDIQFSCLSNKLVIRGHYIKISDIVDKKCPEKIEFIDIFALNKVFIDTNLNKTGDKVHLSIIAPTWDIIGCQKIILDGKPGEAYVQVKAGGDEKDGKPGLPGGSAGNLIGIGQEFINGGYLSISAKGGKGGPGQHGADGARGQDGYIPSPLPNEIDINTSAESYLSEWAHNGFTYKEIKRSRFANMDNFEYHVYGKNCADGENGSNGGAGGKGGNSGDILIVNRNKDLKIRINSSQGETGTAGVGGNGGVGITQLLVYTKIGFKHSSFLRPYRNCSLSKSGIAGQNNAGIQEPESAVILLNPSQTVNDYKNYLRENLSGSIRESFLMEFHDHLLNNETVNELYDTLGFVNELQGLETQYHKLHREVPFLPFYKSLLHRISQYADNPKDYERSMEYKKALTYIYTATLTKICSINNILKNNLVIDLNGYLDLVLIKINKLEDLINVEAVNKSMVIKQMSINENKKKYQDVIEAKLGEAQYFIDAHIAPEINNLDIQLLPLINEAITLKDEAKQRKETFQYFEYGIRKEKLKKAEKKLEGALVLQIGFGLARIGSAIIHASNYLGQFIGTTLDAGIRIGQPISLKNISTDDADRVPPLPRRIENSVREITDQLKDKLQAFKIQLDDADQDLEKYLVRRPSNNIADIKKIVTNTKKSIELEISKGSILDPRSVDKIRTSRKAILHLVQKEIEALKKQNRSYRRLQKIKDSVKVTDIPVEVINDIRNHEAKTKLVNKAIEAEEKRITQLEKYEDNIYKTIIPVFRDIEDKATALVKNLEGKSHVTLDISKWQIQSAIKNVKFLMRKITAEFDVQEDLTHCIEKLEEGMSMVINVYDNIENYYDKIQLAASIADISSYNLMELKVENVGLNNAIKNLTLIIKSNLILGQYESAMNAFKHYSFPFAHLHLAKFSLPPALKLTDNNTKSLVANVDTQIEQIRDRISKSAAIMNKHDKYIHADITFKSSHRSPLFIWRQDINKTVISELLEREEVILKADITKDITKNPIEFNVKGIFNNNHRSLFRSPFFIWRHDINKATISKLLEGEEVTLNADITKGINKDAIKFNVIGIRFKLANETMQEELDEQLENFDVTMTHLGNSYYRCGNRIYTITSDKQVIVHSLGYNLTSGEPFRTNVVYDEIKKNDCVLSPYAMWIIKLTNVNDSFNILAKYKNEVIDLELEGRGQYIDQDIGLCDDNLNNYYKLDDTKSDMNTINVYNQQDSIISHHGHRHEKSYNRTRRGIMEERDLIDAHIGEDSFATSGTCSNFRSSLISNVFNLINNSLKALTYINPVNKITQWLAIDDKSIDQDKTDNSFMQMKFINIPNLPVESSDRFIDKDSCIKQEIDYTSLNREGNLLLLDLLIRKKNGVKHNNNDIVNHIIDNEYSQNLAYNAYAPNDKNLLLN